MAVFLRRLYHAHLERSLFAASRGVTASLHQQRPWSSTGGPAGQPDPEGNSPGSGEEFTDGEEAWEELPVKEDLLEQFLGDGMLSRSQLLQRRLQQVTREYGMHEGDCGSSQVQVARLTERIKWLGEHMAVHRKDFSSRRGLERCINQRRKLLQYMRRTDFDAYIQLLPRLGLRDVFAKMDRLTLAANARHLLHGPVKKQKQKRR